ncbi:fimbria/pilus periplasmic chaperone [Salmonella sp. WGH-01]|nr:fimbria/pilus periplasmic chaperone [Salmonella sp. WGH-01]
MATDRESLFWLNIYQIPPVTQTLKPPAKTGVTASFEAKILIRPTGLKAPTEAEEKNYALLLKRILYG